MKYKVVSLILIIPLVLMFCVFSAANIASLKVPIAVNSVTIFHDNQEKLNLAEGNEFQINAQVMPRNASNKGLIYSYERVNNSPLPNLEISEEGLVKASGYGIAKITVTTKDGAYKRSFLLEVTSTIATDLEISLNTQSDIIVGDEFTLNCNVLPVETLDKSVIFSSSDSNIVRIDELTGECIAISSGIVTLKATLDNALNGTLEKELQVVVLPTITSSLITFEGKQNLTENIFSSQFSALMEVNFTSLYELGKTLSTNDIILEYDNTQVENVSLNLLENNSGIYKYTLTVNGLNADNFNLKARLNFDNFNSFYSEINLEKVVDLNELAVSLTNFPSFVKKGSTYTFNVKVLPQDFTEYQVFAYFTNSNITLMENNNVYYLRGTEVGENTLNIQILVEGDVIKTFTKEIEVLNPPTSINFVHNTNNYGIEDLLTLGNEQVLNNEYIQKQHTFDFTTEVDLDYIQFSSSDESIAKFVDNKLVILNEGKIIITAEELQSKLLGTSLTANLEVRCVKGVEVDSYKDLLKATKDSKQVVLTNDIMLGEKLIEVKQDGSTKLLKTESECAKILSEELNQIETTSEWNYYKNNPNVNAQTPPLINYIIKFTNNCYGNGYVLNADNITNLVDGTNSLYSFAKFRGPLDLVAIPNASVKAQDNICFIASSNVMLNNVELVGANMRGVDNSDLNQLNYVGTVLEIMGDNVKIVNSRIRNGRNCVRVFGKESGNYDKINVLIESCVISSAREFLVKMGTNSKLYGEFAERDSINLADGNLPSSVWEECSPKINDFRHLNDGTLTESEYNALVQDYNQNAEYQALIKTNLTIKNCVLHTSGLFSIGLESSFAGPALDGGKWNSWNFNNYGWRKIAGTSYPTMLNLEGSVKIYDWKNLSNIDSSTLIEGGMFDFNLSKMIDNLYTSGDFNDIISVIDGEKYAHGGIVMYGGGKNYSLVNYNLQNVEELNNYSLSLDTLNTSLTTMLKYASGKEHFRIFMYGKNSTFNYYKQVADMQSGLAYNELGKYII